jgi:hypothetical protein
MCGINKESRDNRRNPTSRNEEGRNREQSKYKQYKSRPKGKTRYKKVYEAGVESSDEEIEYHIDAIETARVKDEAHTNVKLNGKTTRVKIDTGAKINVMKISVLEKIQENVEIRPQNAVVIKAYGGEKFSTLGTAHLACSHNGAGYGLTFHIIPRDRPGSTLLGLNDSLKLGLVKLSKEVHVVNTEEKEFEDYKHLFDNSKLGKLPVAYKMQVDKNMEPVVKPPRKIPMAMVDSVKEELERMEDIGVIKQVEEATEWVSSMVAAKKKNGDIRICIDPRDLNKALQRPHHPMRTIEEVVRDMPNAKIFSSLDAKSGFWQIPLAPESCKYTTFNTPFGRYQFQRLPFGLNSSSEVYQRTMEQLFSGYPCKIIVDDILVWGVTREEHDRNLQSVLKRCEEVNMQLNKSKCKIRVTELSYIGHLLTDEGVIPDPAKIKAVTEMPPPEDKTGLQRLLGMTNYVAKFIPNYSEKTEILRGLLHKDTEWCWLEQHQNAFQQLKDALSSPPTLQYYDVKKPAVLTCDASKSGLGAALIQNNKPVAYASRAMTECETRYAQIEKELLAVTFACKKFNDYIYGKEIVVETDHQPLITIVNKPLHTAPTRLQKMLLQLQRYNFTLVYKPGKELYIADTLSRAYLPNTDTEEEDGFEVMELMCISERRAEQLREVSQECDIHKELSKNILNGWPENSNRLPQKLKPYFAFRDELTIENGIILKSHRVLIPQSLRKEYLKELHLGHPGVDATKARAKDTVFWIGIQEDIEKLTANCESCNTNKPRQQKEPMKMHEIPTLPYEIVAADLFTWRSQTYMVTVDSYSGFYDIDKLSDMTSTTVIQKLKKQFSIHGVPKVFMSDNGTQFVSQEFKNFANVWNFQTITSSPRYPQSNGLSERAVRSAKSLMEKCAQDNSDPYLALLLIRNTPRPGLESSAERLFSRHTRTILPTSESVLKPKIIKDVSKNLKKNRMQQKAYYDKTAKDLPQLRAKDVIRVEMEGKFDKKGEVIEAANRPRGYIIKVDGKRYERNRKHLRKVQEPNPQPTAEIEEDYYIPPEPPEEPQLAVPREPRIEPQVAQVFQPAQPELQVEPEPQAAVPPAEPEPQAAVPPAVQKAPTPARPTKTRSGRKVKRNRRYDGFTK